MANATPVDLDKVRQQVEFYFSDANFRRDKFLQAKAAEDPEGCECFHRGNDVLASPPCSFQSCLSLCC
jgi:hypothetical protein